MALLGVVLLAVIFRQVGLELVQGRPVTLHLHPIGMLLLLGSVALLVLPAYAAFEHALSKGVNDARDARASAAWYAALAYISILFAGAGFYTSPTRRPENRLGG
jgi:hypothetical protein